MQSAFYEMMERIIEQVMLRYKSTELVKYKDQYKRVYEEIALNYLCLLENEEGLSYSESEILSLIRGCVEKIKKENNRRFNMLFSDENITEDKLGELFFTNVALMEYHFGRIRFSTIVFAYHLTARALLRTFMKEDYSLCACYLLDSINYKYRYYVIVIASSLALHLTDIRFYSDFGENANEIRFKVADLLYEYYKSKWEKADLCIEERDCIKESVLHILGKQYDENVFTNKNMKNDEYLKWLNDVIKN